MYKKHAGIVLTGLVVLALGLILAIINIKEDKKLMTTVNNHQTKTSLQLTSPAFEEGGNIPDSYTCQGQNVNPPLNITNVPGAAASLALIMHDPDAVSGDFVHWLMWDIPPSTKTIATGNVPSGVIQGLNSASQSKYMGPCPPSGTGTHRYMFELYALDESPKNLDMETSREQLQKAMANHILAQHTLTGLFSAPTSR